MLSLISGLNNAIGSVPALYEKYYNTSGGPAVDEWDLTMLMNADGSINKLKDHYKMFIVSPYMMISPLIH